MHINGARVPVDEEIQLVILWGLKGRSLQGKFGRFQVSTVYLHYYRSSRHIVFMCRLIALEVMVYYLQRYNSVMMQ
jgi:hypothetical protein